MIKNILMLCASEVLGDCYNQFYCPSLLEKKVIEYDQVLKFISDNKIDTLICDASQIHIASRLLWMSNSLKRYILTDTDNPLLVETFNRKVTAKMWDVIAEQTEGENPVRQSGWISSYTNESFSEEEMEEYAKNAVYKLSPYLFKEASVLEIGIASGITCFEIAPYVKKYIGIDISKETLKKTERTLLQKGIMNVKLIMADAMEVTQLNLDAQDIVIINSVAQYFPGYNYFLKLVKELLYCLKEKGIIFLGDILDFDLKGKMERELEEKGIKKRNVRDLYYPISFIKELPAYLPEIVNVKITKKQGRLENELKKYRYDVILHIDKKHNKTEIRRTKFQYAMLSESFSIKNILANEEY